MTTDSYGKYQLTDEVKAKVEDRVCRLIESGVQEQSGLHTRWQENMRNYQGANDFAVPFLEGVSCPSFNIVAPRINALTDNVVGQITSMNPMLMAEMRGNSDRLETMEDLLAFFFDLANLDEKLRQTCMLCGIYDLVHIHVTYDHVVEGFYALSAGEGATVDPEGQTRIAYTGLYFDVIPPEDFVIVKSNSCDLANSPLVGHRIRRLRRDVKALQAVGRYYDTDELSEASNITKVIDQTEQKVTPSDTGFTGDEVIDLYDVVVRMNPSEIGVSGKDDTLFHAIVSYDDRKLLCLKPYALKRPNYAGFRLKTAIPGSYWPSGSVAQDLQPLQNQYNHITAFLIYGGYFAAFPTVVTNGNPNQSQGLKPAQMTFIDGTEMQIAKTDFDPSTLLPMQQEILKMADAQVGISQAGLGQEFSADPTATEVQNVAAGQATRIQGFAAQFAQGLEQLASISQEVLSTEQQFWSGGIYGDQIPAGPELLGDLQKPIRWVVTGKKPDATPRSMIEKYKLLLSMAGEQSGQAVIDAAVGFMEEMGLAPEAIQAFQQTAMGLGGPFDQNELYKSIVNNLELPNGNRIFKQDEQPQSGPSGSPPVPIQNSGMAFAKALAPSGTGGATQGPPQY